MSQMPQQPWWMQPGQPGQNERYAMQTFTGNAGGAFDGGATPPMGGSQFFNRQPPQSPGFAGGPQATDVITGRANTAAGLGYTPVPGSPGYVQQQAPYSTSPYSPFGGSSNGMMIAPLGAGSPFASGPGALDQMAWAVGQDTQNTQNAMDFNWARNNEAQAGFGQAVEQAPGNIMASGRQATGDLSEAIAAQRRIGSETVAYADNAAKETEQKFRDTTSAEIATQTAAISNQMRNQLEGLNAGVNPDGTLMTPEQRESQRTQLQTQFAFQKAQIATTINSQFNKDLASLRTNLQGLGQQARGIQAGTEQVASGLAQAMATVRQSSTLAATEALLQGRAQLAQMIQGNPYGTVSLFSGLAALFAAGTAPGAGNVRAFNTNPQQGQPQFAAPTMMRR